MRVKVWFPETTGHPSVPVSVVGRDSGSFKSILDMDSDGTGEERAVRSDPQKSGTGDGRGDERDDPK